MNDYERAQFMRRIRRAALALDFKSGYNMEYIASSREVAQPWNLARIESELRSFMNERDR